MRRRGAGLLLPSTTAARSCVVGGFCRATISPSYLLSSSTSARFSPLQSKRNMQQEASTQTPPTQEENVAQPEDLLEVQNRLRKIQNDISELSKSLGRTKEVR